MRRYFKSLLASETQKSQPATRRTRNGLEARYQKRSIRRAQFESLEERHVLASLLQTLTPPTTANSAAQYGFHVAAGPDYNVAGAHATRIDGVNQAGRVFVHSAATGGLQQTLQHPTPRFSSLGYSVAVTGNSLIAGAPYDTVDSVSFSGSAHLFSASTGAYITQISNPTPNSDDQFGTAVAASGNLVAIGAPRDDAGGSNAGAVHLFDATSGAFVRTILNPDVSAGNQFGWSIAMSGDTLVVGGGATAPNKAVHIFDASTGSLLRSIYDPIEYMFSSFGSTVALAGTRVVVGNSIADIHSTDDGVAYVFDVNTGARLYTLQNPVPNNGDNFGFSVAAYGDYAVVGAPRDDAGANDVGSAYLFDAVTGSLVDTLSNPTPDANDRFGWSVAVYGDRVLVGATQDSAAGTGKGAAHVFTLGPPPFAVQLSNSGVAENQAAGTVVGTLSAGAGSVSPVTFKLIAGSGSDDNSKFTIVGDQLRTSTTFDYEVRSTYSVRVEAKDANGLLSAQIYSIQITNQNESPTALALSSTTIDEMQPAGAVVGLLSTSDPDLGDSFTYSLVFGDGSQDNGAFTIEGNELRAAASLDYEDRARYSIRVRATDAGNLSVERAYVIQVRDVNPPPIDVLPSFDLRPVIDLNDTVQSSHPTEAVELEGVVYFPATTPGHGSELWRTDGSPTGTWMVTEASGADRDSSPRSLHAYNGQLIYLSNYDHIDPDAPPGGEPEHRVGLFAWNPAETEAILLQWFDSLSPIDASMQTATFAEVGGNLLLIIATTSGNQLWRTDGTATGTQLITTLPVGPDPIAPAPSALPTATLGNVLVMAFGSGSSQALWRTDGSSTGTFLLREWTSFSPPSGSSPSLVTVGDKVYFVSSSSDEGNELWSTDGSAEGTQLVRDIRPGWDDSFIQSMVSYNGQLYFTADDGSHGTELWQSDGTLGNTKLVKDIYPDWGSGIQSSLWVWNGHLYFAGDDGSTGIELWKSDGTAAGTNLVADVDAGPGGTSPTQFIDLGDTLLFTTGTWSSYPNQLWKTDGSGPGTAKIADVGGDQYTVSGGKAFFRTGMGDGVELWVTDGTEPGTRQLNDLNPGAAAGLDKILGVALGGVVFRGMSASIGTEIGVSDGTAMGTRLIDVARGTPPSDIHEVIKVGNDFYVATASQLIKTDGTKAGTVVLKTDIGARNLTALGNSVYFTAAATSSQGRELWRTDGTIAGTVLHKDIWTGTNNSSDPHQLRAFADSIFFIADDGANGRELWRSNLGDAKAALHTDFVAGSEDGDIRSMVVVGESLYVVANDQLHRIDQYGNLVTLAMVGSGTLMPWGDIVYFSGYSAQHGYELWRTDGTLGGTYMVADLLAGPDSSYPGGGAVVEGSEQEGGGAGIEAKLVFRASIGELGTTANTQLWATNGTTAGTVQLTNGASQSDEFGNVAAFMPLNITSLGGKVIFEAYDALRGRELWESNGTQAGTRLLAELTPGPAPDPLDHDLEDAWYDQRAESLVVVGDQLFFRKDNRVTGSELWVTGGTAASTRQALDIIPGARGGYPKNMLLAGDRLYVVADTLEYGTSDFVEGGGELFYVNESPSAAALVRVMPKGQALAIELSAGDRNGDELAYEIVTQPASGTVTLVNGIAVFTPDADFTGHLEFTYRAFDGSLYSNIATISVDVLENLNTISFTAASTAVTEQNGMIYIDVQLAAPAATMLAVPYTVDGADALANANQRVNELVIPVGAISARIPLHLREDLTHETVAQVLEITLQPNAQVMLGTYSQHLVNISDNDAPPTVRFMTPWRTVSESDETLGVQVGLSAASDEVVRVTVRSSHLDSATRGVDFIAAAETVVEFQPGEMVKTVPIRLLEDTLAEKRELIRLSLESVLNGVVGSEWSEHSHLTWIEDNDISVVNLSPSVQIAQESQTLTIVAARSGGNTNVPLTVPYTVWNSGANASDYTFSSNNFEFAANETTATLSVQLVSDSIAEPFEGFAVELREGGAFVPGSLASAYIGIESSDFPTASLVFGDTNLAGVANPRSLSERNPHGSQPITIEVIARLSNPSAEVISIPLTVSSGQLSGFATRGVDYDLDTAPVVFDSGVTEVIRTLTIYDDLETELDEVIRVALDPRSDQHYLRSGGLNDSSSLAKSLTIRNDDVGVTVTGPTSVDENSGQVQYVISLAEPAPTTLSVAYGVSGTANRNDWSPDPSSAADAVVFLPGQQSKTVTLQLLDDNIFEGPETLTFQVGRNLNGRFQPLGSVTTTLADNDAAPTVSFRHTGFGLTATDIAPFTIPIDLSHPSTQPVTLDVVISGSAVTAGNTQISTNPGQLWIPDTAPPPSDDPLQNVISGQLIIPANAMAGEIRVTPSPLMEGSHELEVAINGGINISVPDVRPRTTREIIDSDEPRLPIPRLDSTSLIVNPGTLLIFAELLKDPSVRVVNQNKTPIDDSQDLEGWNPGSLALPESSGQNSGGSTGITTKIDGKDPDDARREGFLAAAVEVGIHVGKALFKAFQGVLSGSELFFDANFNGGADFLDANGNGRQDEGELAEPRSTSGADGSFGMIILDAFDRDGSGRVEAHEGRLVLRGGTDLSTGLEWPIALSAPAGSSVVTPLTTLVEHLLRHSSRTPEDALQQVKSSLGVSDYNLVGGNTIHEILDGDPIAAVAYQQQVIVSSLAIELASFIEGATGRAAADAADEFFGIVANTIDRANGPVDWANPVLVRSTLTRMTQALDVPPADAELDEIAAVVARGAQRIQRLNSRSFATPKEFLIELTQVKKLMHGEIANALRDVGASNMAVAELAATYGEENFDARAAAQQIGEILPPSVGVMHAHVVEGNDGQRMLEFTVALVGEHEGEVRVDYATEDGTAAAGFDYTAQSGTLVWAPGDTSVRVVQVPVLGDQKFETDEYLGLRLLNAKGVVVRFERGVGYIVNDDTLAFTSNTDAELNRITVALNRERVDIAQNGATVRSGELYQPLTAELTGRSDKPNDFVISFDTIDFRADNLTLLGGQSADTTSLRSGRFAGVKHVVTSNGGDTIVLTTVDNDEITVTTAAMDAYAVLVTELDEFLLELPSTVTDVVIEDADPNVPGTMIIRSASGKFAPIELTNPATKIRIEASSPEATLNTVSTDPEFGGTIEFVVPAEENAPPKIEGIYVRGNNWTTSYLNLLANNSLGSPAHGFKLNDGAAQISAAGALTWQSIQQIAITFTEEVNVTKESLRVLNASNQDLAFASTNGFAYDSETRTARWTLATPLARSKYLLSLSAAAVTDMQGAALDGEWTTSVSTYASSGDGSAGGDLNFRFNYLPGDVTANGQTNTADVGVVRAVGIAIPTAANYRFDVTGNNQINTADVGFIRSLGIQTLIGLQEPQNPPSPQATAGAATTEALSPLQDGPEGEAPKSRTADPVEALLLTRPLDRRDWGSSVDAVFGGSLTSLIGSLADDELAAKKSAR